MKKLSKIISQLKDTQFNEDECDEEIESLQLKMLEMQQSVWHSKKRVIIVFEGFDASGKGGAIKALTKNLDPRGAKVIPVGAPTQEEQDRHWLYRFWRDLPLPGNIVIFDRSWYGRVLVERVDELTPKKRWKEAFQEINHFENMLEADGIVIIKFFLAISKDEQYDRLEARIKDPKKIWKVSLDDIKARKKWDEYVESVEDILKHTHHWKLIATDHKKIARRTVLETVTKKLSELDTGKQKETAREILKKVKKELTR